MEKRDLYDINKKIIGKTINKGEKIPDNTYIIVVSIFIQNDEGKILIEKRSEKKGGKYGLVSGHPKAGQNSLQGIMTETREEIGLELEKRKIKILKEGRKGNKFFDIYYINKNIEISSLEIQKEEVESVHWFTKNEIKELIKQELFFENHKEAFFMVEKSFI